MAAVFVVGLFFLSVPEAILIGTTVVLVVACIIGLFAFWNISFNLSSITLLCLAVGFSVDYSAHISKAFSEQSTSLSKADRVGTALVNQGSAVVHAGASTFVAVIVLSGASMEGYVVLFKSMLGMVSATSSVPHPSKLGGGGVENESVCARVRACGVCVCACVRCVRLMRE